MKNSFVISICSVMLVHCPKLCTSKNFGLEPRIFGERTTEQFEFPFIASLSRRNGHFCGGTIIHEEWIITTSSCVNAGDFKVTAGEHNTQMRNKTEQKVNPIAVVHHFTKDAVLHDLVLVKVNPAFEFNRFVEAVSLPSRRFVASGYATVIGWGTAKRSNGTDYIPSPVPRKIILPIHRSSLCQEQYGNHFNRLTQLCAGGEGGHACLVESGGPLICKNRAYADPVGVNITVFCGVVSYGSGCGRPDSHGVYTKVSFYRDWIEEIIPDLKSDMCEKSLTRPLHRYYNKKTKDHLYTIDWNELEAGNKEYKYEGIEAYIFPTEVPETVPLYRFKNRRNGDNLYTRHEAHKEVLLSPGKDDGYDYKGITGYVYPNKVRGSVELYRYYDHNQSGDHFYTTDWTELREGYPLGKGYFREGIDIAIFVCPRWKERFDSL